MVLGFDPFRDFDRLAGQMFGAGGDLGARAIPMDLYRSDDHYVLHCDLAGVDPGSVDVTMDGPRLTIRAERSGRTDDEVHWLLRERPAGTFTRQLVLGDGLDTGNIAATYHDGVLTVTIPIAEHAKPRKIAINSPGAANRTLEGTVVGNSAPE